MDAIGILYQSQSDRVGGMEIRLLAADSGHQDLTRGSVRAHPAQSSGMTRLTETGRPLKSSLDPISPDPAVGSRNQ